MKSYPLTLQDMEALARCISTLDEQAHGTQAKIAAKQAHSIIERNLGADADKVYCQEDAA